MSTQEASSELTAKAIKWIHISDLHFGQGLQAPLWPTFKRAFFDDLQRMSERTGPWDLVIFSGDLTQTGTAAEFAALSDALSELWGIFKRLGSEPYLFIVPGNHDLQRPDGLDPAARMLKRWWDEEEIRKDFWENEKSAYLKCVQAAFSGYEEWRANLAGTGIKMLETRTGKLPGDSSAVLEVDGVRLGIVGLNSAWLQLSGGDYQGSLDVNPWQLLAVTENEPDQWSSKNNFNLLVTHHPADWLHDEALAHWRSEIETRSRFDLHLFGHMHESNATIASRGGGSQRRQLQAASLFGLETFGKELKRVHGYTLGQLSHVDSITTLRVWPRKAVVSRDGTRRFAPDVELDLTEENYFEHRWGLDPIRMNPPEDKGPLRSTDRLLGADRHSEILKTLRRTMLSSEAFSDVRRVEQSVLVDALKKDRAAWLVTGWGLGEDELIDVVQPQIFGAKIETYYLDFHGFQSQDELLIGLKDRVGVTFEQVLDALADAGTCALILDDVLSLDEGHGSAQFERELNHLIQVILEYCPELRLIVRSRKEPSATRLSVVELLPMDEADTASYIRKHPKGGADLASPETVSRIHRHTDGLPARIDAVLKNLHIVGIRGVHNFDSDVAGKSAGSVITPEPLTKAIQVLAQSDDAVERRAFRLLKVLTLFPQGERLQRIKRFHGAAGFHPEHAALLIDRAFVESASTVPVEVQGSELYGERVLVVRRPVRELLYQMIAVNEFRALNARALSLYFGESWEIKGLQTPGDLRFDQSTCRSSEISNANTLILRAASGAFDGSDAGVARKILALINAYNAALRRGGHFRSIASLCEDLLPLVERSSFDLDLSQLRLQHAAALRMIGENERSRDILLDLDEIEFSKSDRQSLFLNLALNHKSLGENDDAVAAAKRSIDVEPDVAPALQAESIVVEIGQDGKERDIALQALEAKARKRGFHTVANNIALSRASQVVDLQRRRSLIEEVLKTSRESHDSYTAMRAVLRLAKDIRGSGGSLSRQQMRDLVSVYNQLFVQRIEDMFDDCHDLLWWSLEERQDVKSLLSLYRHSSLVWRLRARGEGEKAYVLKLLQKFSEVSVKNIRTASRDLAYFLTRSLQLSS